MRSSQICTLGTLIFTSVVCACVGVHISEMNVPSVVQHNSSGAVLLDCVYQLSADETDLLIVKWFFNSERHLVYQWAAGLRPAASGQLRDQLQLQHVASEQRLQRHRAMLIRNPTVCMSGVYICRVSTSVNVATASRSMLVYAPARYMNLTYYHRQQNIVQVTCSAGGVYPMPEVKLYLRSQSRPDRLQLTQVDMTSEVTVDYLLNVHVTSLVDSRRVGIDVMFECSLKIPGTQYSLLRALTYVPDGFHAASTSGTSEIYAHSTSSTLTQLFVLVFVLFSLAKQIT